METLKALSLGLGRRDVLNYKVLILLTNSVKVHMSMHNAHMQISPSLHFVW